MINMGTHLVKGHLAIYFLVGILCLPLASCITTTPETQTIVGSTASITEENSCNTNLEKGPSNNTQYKGKKVTLNCDVNDNNTHNILWRRSSGLGNWRTISNNITILYKPSASYKIKFDFKKQTYKFVIRKADISDDSGIYECGYECTPGGSFISLASAEVTVIHRPTCVIQTLPFSRSDRGNEFEVVCSWAPGQEGDAYIESGGAPKYNTNLSYKDRIISRFESNDTANVTCRFSSRSDPSLTTAERCTMKDGKVRVDPFINEVAAGSNASFVCSSDNSTHSWNITLPKELSIEGNERTVEHENSLTIIDVNKSDQDILVECSVQDHGTWNISSFGIIRIVEVTTHTLRTPGDYTTQLNYRGTSGQAHETSPRSSRPTSSSTVAALTTYRSVSAQLPTGSLACKRYRLPSPDGSALNREFEVICSWTVSQENYPHFQGVNGEIIDADIKLPDQIITRVNSSGTNISCRLSVNTNTSRIDVTKSCKEDIKPRLIRVDPFIGKVNIDSSILYNCTFNQGGVKGRKTLSFKVNSDGNVSAINTGENSLHRNVDFFVHEHESRKYLLVECHFQSSYFTASNESSYGILRVVEGTTTEFHTQPTVSGDRYNVNSNVTLDVRSSEASVFTTFKTTVTGAHSAHTKLSTSESSTQYGDDQTVNTSIEEEGEENSYTANHTTTANGQPLNDVTLSNSHTNTGPSKERQVSTDALATTKTTDMIESTQNGTVKVLLSLLAVLAVIIFLIAIMYLKKKLLPPRRQDKKPDGIELSNIPHILHEESSQWYALSFKDKRVQQSPSDDLETLHHHDHSGDTLNGALCTSIGMLTLQPSDFSNDHLYAEPGAADTSEEPLRDIISRQQCTFTPLTDSD